MLVTKVSASWLLRDLRHIAKTRGEYGKTHAVTVSPRGVVGGMVGFPSLLSHAGRARIYRAGKLVRVINLPYPLQAN